MTKGFFLDVMREGEKGVAFKATIPPNTWLGLTLGKSTMFFVDIVIMSSGFSPQTSSVRDARGVGFKEPEYHGG